MGAALRLCLLAAVSTWSSACHRDIGSPTQHWRPLFGPVITDEVIVGHVATGSVAWLMTSADALVRINLDTGTHVRTVLRPLADGEHAWGLASAEGLGLWTLIGRSTLASVAGDGRILRRVSLAAPHVGVFGVGKALAYQVMSFTPPADALATGRPEESTRTAWSHMRTRALPLARTAVAALNLVSCGSTANGTVPCWFPDQAQISLTDPSGQSRDMALEGLPVVAPEVLLASENPRRPVRDAFVSASGAIWVLGSGLPPTHEEPERPGGWLLMRYDSNGVVLSKIHLREPARLLLGVRDDDARGDRCVVLTWNGTVVEVRP